MCETDICISYRDAKFKSKQIRILSELNDCSVEVIKRVLRKHGYDIPAQKEKVKAAAEKTKKEQVEVPVVVTDKKNVDRLVSENIRLRIELAKAYEFMKSYGLEERVNV